MCNGPVPPVAYGAGGCRQRAAGRRQPWRSGGAARRGVGRGQRSTAGLRRLGRAGRSGGEAATLSAGALDFGLADPLRLLGKLDRPALLFAGIDLEEAGPVIASRQAIVEAANGELLFAGAHERLAAPFPALVVVDRVDIVVSRRKRPLEDGLAIMRRDVPPSFRQPAILVAIAHRDTDAARRVVAQPEIRRARASREGSRRTMPSRRSEEPWDVSWRDVVRAGFSCQPARRAGR